MLVICLDVSQNGFLFSSTSTFFASFVLRVHNSSSFLPYSPSYYLFFFCTCPSIYSVPHLMLLFSSSFNPLKPELNPICYLLALLGAHHFLYVSRIRVKLVTFRLLMSYIYIYIYIYIYMEHPFLMFLDHTQRRSTVGRTPLDE